MPTEIIPVADLPSASPGALDSVVGVDEATGAARRFHLPTLPLGAAAQAQLDAIDGRVETLEAGQAAGQIVKDGGGIAGDGWAALSAIATTGAGHRGAQIIDDPGTHTDPVVGGTVPNGGQYVEYAAGWKWVRAEVLVGEIQERAANDFRHDNSLIAAHDKVDVLHDALESMPEYIGASSVVPLFVDEANRLVIGVSEYGVIASGLTPIDLAKNLAPQFLAEKASENYVGAGPVYPIIIDSADQVILGYNDLTKQLVGPGIGGSSGGATAVVRSAQKPLAVAPVKTQWLHLLHDGQSLSTGNTGSPVLSATQPYANLTFTGGTRPTYDHVAGTQNGLSTSKPLAESTYETACSSSANYAVELMAAENGEDPANNVIFCSTAGLGGYRIEWLRPGSTYKNHDSTAGDTYPDSPTNWYQVLIDQVTAAKALADAASKSYSVPMIVWIQGEADEDLTQAEYLAELLGLQAEVETDIQAITGQVTPVYFATYQTPRNTKTVPTSQAQLQAARESDRFFLFAPIYHLPNNDGTHLTNVGYVWMGHYAGRALKTLMDGNKPQWINPVSATARGDRVTIKFDVPVKPLLFDAATLAPTTDNGFKVTDSSGVLTLTGMTVNALGDEVTIQCNRAVAGGATVRYGLDYTGAGNTFIGVGTGNLRDSEPATFDADGSTYPLYNVCPHFTLNIINLGA